MKKQKNTFNQFILSSFSILCLNNIKKILFLATKTVLDSRFKIRLDVDYESLAGSNLLKTRHKKRTKLSVIAKAKLFDPLIQAILLKNNWFCNGSKRHKNDSIRKKEAAERIKQNLRIAKILVKWVGKSASKNRLV